MDTVSRFELDRFRVVPLTIEQGALNPALYRLEHQGVIGIGVGIFRKQPAGEVLSLDRRRPKTPAGRDPGNRVASAMATVLRPTRQEV